MKKAFFIFILSLIITTLVFTIYYFKMHNDLCLPETMLLELFKNSGAKFVNSEMNFQAKLNEECQNEEYLNRLMEDLTNSLGLDKNFESDLDIVENDFMQKLEINGETEYKEIVNICIELIKGQGENLAQNKYTEGIVNLSITETESCPYSRLQDIRNHVEAVFIRYKIKPEVNCTIVGCFEGKLDNKGMNEVCKNVFSTVEARKVGGIAEKNLIGVSAYSPAIGSFIEVNGNRTNIHINFRYSSYEKKTFVWIGIPVIIK